MLFEQILSLIPCAVFWKDVNGIFQGCNLRFMEFANVKDKSKIIGKSDKELSWANRWQEYYNDDQYVITTGKTITRIEKVTLIDKTISAHTTKTPWHKDGETIGVLGVIYDISELMEAKEQAEIANRLKSQFIQDMQHDIRTPASGVWKLLENMAEVEEDPEKQNKLILLRDSSKELWEICNNVIDFDKADSGEMIICKKMDIYELVSKVFKLNQAAALNKELEFSYHVDKNVPHVVKGDSFRVSKILLNLIGNAIKFTQQGSVSLSAKLIRSENKEVVLQFEVRDTGVGIPQDKKNFIYGKFNRLIRANRGDYKGSGLGLHIVKQLVDELNGEIDVHSQLGKGTTFYITLSFGKPITNDIYDDDIEITDNTNNLRHTSNMSSKKLSALINDIYNDEQAAIQSKNNPISQSNVNLNAVKILLIEDDPLALMVAQNTIRSINCNVTAVDTARRANEALNHTKFDVVISDIGLPDGSGLEIVRNVKEKPNALNHTTLFLALTAHTDTQKILEATKAGFATVLSKPLAKELIQALIEVYLHQSTANALEANN